jgi:hypothetical protein
MRERLDPLLRHLPTILFAALCLAALVGLLVYRPDAQYDTISSLVWSRDILEGRLPDFEVYRAPTPHPLLLLIGLPMQALGATASLGMVFLGTASFLAIVAGVHRLGKLGAGVLCGLAAAAIVATRLDLWWLTVVGYLDIPYAALVVWAVVLEAERPRRGAPVWILLTLAGLLRPEAWLLLGLYVLWMGWHASWGARLRYVAIAAIAPVLWCATDLVVTGNPLFSLLYTDSLAEDLSRERPLHTLPWLMLKFTDTLLKPPVFALALLGAALAIRMRRRELVLPGVLVLTTWFSYLVIATGGLATVWRYLLLAAVGGSVFAAFALTGWTTLGAGHRRRRPWAIGAGVAVALGLGWTVLHVNPAKIDSELRTRTGIVRELRDVLERPEVVAARRCGPISVPNHKLLPALRWYFPDDEVIARSDTARGVQRSGVAISIERRYENRPDINVREVPTDDAIGTQLAPPGFRHVGGNAYYGVSVRCP